MGQGATYLSIVAPVEKQECTNVMFASWASRRKVGDPLWPLLFNLCLEPQLERNEEQTSGINVNESWKIRVLTFADNVVLLGADEREAQRQVDVLHEYLPGYDHL